MSFLKSNIWGFRVISKFVTLSFFKVAKFFVLGCIARNLISISLLGDDSIKAKKVG